MPYLDKDMNILDAPKKPYVKYVCRTAEIIKNSAYTLIPKREEIIERVYDVGSKEEIWKYKGKEINYREEFYTLKTNFEIDNLKLLNTYSKRNNVFPYHYKIVYSDEKIRVSSKVIGFNFYKGKLITQIYSTALVFNLRTGRTYLLGTKDQKGKFIKINGTKENNVKSVPIMDITYADILTLHGYGVFNFIRIPDKEWNNIAKKIAEYNNADLTLKYCKKESFGEFINIIRFNRFPYVKNMELLRNIEGKIEIKGMKKNVLSYIEREKDDSTICNDFKEILLHNIDKKCMSKQSILNDLDKNNTEENLILKAKIFIISIYINKIIGLSKEYSCEIAFVIIMAGLTYNRTAEYDSRREAIKLEESVEEWFKLIKKTKGKDLSAKIINRDKKILGIVLNQYKELYKQEDNLIPKDDLFETSKVYDEKIKIRRLLNSI